MSTILPYSDEYFMRQALDEAALAYEAGEVPIGAVVVCRGQIIARAHNEVERLSDPTAHAEVLAVTAATEYMGSKFLPDCQLYVTVEPCLMCTGAIVQSRIKKVYIGATDESMGAFVSKIALVKDEMIYPQKIDYAFKKTISGYILSRFFRKIRKNKEKNKL